MSTHATSTSSRSQRPPPMRLRLVRNHGRVADASLDLPAFGGSLAEALELGGTRLSEAQWKNANHCQVRPEGATWLLCNESPGLVCALNGSRIRSRAPVAVSIGDVLEIGLLRFVIESQVTSVSPRAETVPSAKSSVASTAGVRPAVGASEFDLRDLAMPPNVDTSGPRQHASLAPLSGLGLGEAVPSVDALDGLFAEAVQPARDPGDESHDASAFRVDEGRASHPVPNTHDVTRIHWPPRASSSSEDEIFDDLHEEYRRVVRDPDQLAGRAGWAGLLAPRGEPGASIEDLKRAVGTRKILQILDCERGIDQVIEDFDPLGRSALLDKPEIEDVLHLFAPELAHGVKRAVPSLTRREHHALSPDSHVRFGATQRDEPEPLA